MSRLVRNGLFLMVAAALAMIYVSAAFQLV
jgi:hypothetical protein